MADKIKRYTLGWDYDNSRLMEEDPEGEYVTYTDHQAAMREAVGLIPANWLDPLLTGPDAVIGSGPYSETDVENLLRAVKSRLTDFLSAHQECGGGGE